MKARDSPSFQGQEKRRQAVSKSSTSKALQALLQSPQHQREELDAAPAVAEPRAVPARLRAAMLGTTACRHQVQAGYELLPSAYPV